jgi:hypothetical protein
MTYFFLKKLETTIYWINQGQIKKYYEDQFSTSPMLNDEIEKKSIKKNNRSQLGLT